MENGRGGHQATAEEHEMELIKQKLLPSILNDIEAQLKESTSKSGWSIFKVPQALAEGFAEACRPRIVSIGPYHHGEPRLQKFQGQKLRYLHTMLNRTQGHGVSLENLVDVVARKEKMIRQCYSESTVDYDGHEFVQMIVLDGCFIIEFLRERSLRPKDKLLDNEFEINSIMRDLLRLENQLPYFVLEDLFEMTNVPEETFSLADLALVSFEYFGVGLCNALERWEDIQGAHLLDLFRLCLKPSDQQHNPGDKSLAADYRIRSASELHRMGIRFKKREAISFLEIKFHKKSRTLEIPNIAIFDFDINWILTNMVALEQCRGQLEGHITAYAIFMGYIIRTADDVRLLRDCKVIATSGMSNEEFARFFGDVCKDTTFDLNRNYLAPEFAMLSEPPKNERAYLCWAQLVNAFHDNPWSALSALAIVVTLVGMIQTVYAVLQYYHPSK